MRIAVVGFELATALLGYPHIGGLRWVYWLCPDLRGGVQMFTDGGKYTDLEVN